MSEGMSMREYARDRGRRGLRGKSLSAVQRALKSGRIVGAVDPVTGLIDPARADELWAANTAPSILLDPPTPEPPRECLERIARVPRVDGVPFGIDRLARAMAADGWGVVVVPRGDAKVGEVLRSIVDALPPDLPNIEEVFVFDPDE